MTSWIGDLLFTGGLVLAIVIYIVFIDEKINKLLKWISKIIGFKK